MIEERDQHLDELFGIVEAVVEPVVEETTTPAQTAPVQLFQASDSGEDESNKLRIELLQSKTNLESMFMTATNVLTEVAENAQEFQKARDVEAFAALLKNMTDLQAQIVTVSEKMHKRVESTQKQKNITNNNIFVGDMRQLNDIIKGSKK